MRGSVSAVVFEDHARAEVARCYGDGCSRLLVFDSDYPPVDLLGWRRQRVETGSRWGSSQEWRCGEH